MMTSGYVGSEHFDRPHLVFIGYREREEPHRGFTAPTPNPFPMILGNGRDRERDDR
jgi:hypothetical protein